MLSQGSFEIYTQNQEIINALLNQLKSHNAEARRLSLECLSVIYRLIHNTSSDVIDVALTIEGTNPSLETARTISMYIRRLGSAYLAIPPESWIARLIPSYLFGKLPKST